MKGLDRRSIAAGAAALALSLAQTPMTLAASGTPGQVNWQDQFDHTGGTDTVAAMGLRGSKILIVGGTGPSVPGGTNDTWIVRAYDAKSNGEIEWEATFVNPDGGEVTLGGVAASGNRAIVTGSREVPGGHHRLVVRVYNTKTGDLYWDDEVDLGTDDGRGRAVFIKGKKAWVVGSQTDAVSSKTTWWLRAYDAKAGVMTFEDNPAGETDDPRGATNVFLQGSTLVVGGVAQDASGTTDWRLRAYKTKDHSVLWDNTYGTTLGDDVVNGLKGMGKRFVIGGTIAKSGGTQMRILAVETKTGEFLWDGIIDEGTNNTVADVVGHGPCLFLGGVVDGDYLIRGFVTITGVPMWTDRVDTGGDDALLAMATFGSKTVFAGGYLDDGGGSGDYFIRNYDFHTGTVVWDHTQDVDGDDEITGIATKGKGVFTIGNVDKAGSDQDWVVTTHQR